MNHVALRPERLDILSICTGGGGLDLGIELAVPGARSVCLVEREAFAVAQLVSAMEAGHLAPTPVWSDARTFDGRAWRGCVDGLIGGIPCQPHSLAGKRLGEDDERDLWSTARRIIVQSGAWFVLIENVGGMFSSGGAERVWRDLRRLGFASEGGLFTAEEVGASHERERLFILAVADARCSERRTFVDGRCLSDRHADGWDEGAGGAPKPSAAIPGVGLADAYLSGPSVNRGERGDPRSEFAAAERVRGTVGDAEDDHRRTKFQESREGRGRTRPAGNGYAMANADIVELRRQSPAGEQPFLQRDDAVGLFPPGPGDLSSWGNTLERAPELEPAVRRVADGLASRVDVARVDRLRLLGNGVVPLAAAYALRTLATRLAGRGSAGATLLVRMMEAAE